MKIFPIIEELIHRIVPVTCSAFPVIPENKDLDIDMRCMFGYLNLHEWAKSLNIGNMMKVSQMDLSDWLSDNARDEFFSLESILEQVALLSICYFCVANEKCFIHQLVAGPVDDLLSQYRYIEPSKESEYWHRKSLEISCCFLPSNYPLLKNILSS